MDHEQAGSAKGKSCFNNLHIINNINVRLAKRAFDLHVWGFLDMSNAFGSTK